MEAKGKEFKLKKNDLILVCSIVCIVALIGLIRYAVGQQAANYVTIRVNGEITETYPLAEDNVININNGTNVLEIKNGAVRMIEADCPDQICVNHKAISEVNESIVCLPNKIVVEIVGQDESLIDAVTN